MEIKNGIAYSGSKEECGTLEEKIANAKAKKMKCIQLRAEDIMNRIVVNNRVDIERITALSELISSYQGEVSVHLSTPNWDYSTLELSNKNQQVIAMIREILVNLGIEKYTIHPQFNRIIYETLSPNEKRKSFVLWEIILQI